MGKFQKILVPLDGSANSMRGLDKAITIANESGAEITGYYVFHLPVTAGIKYTKAMRDKAQDKAVKAIGPAMQKCERAGAKFKYATGGGNTATQIVNAAKKGNFDMVVIGARGIGNAKEAFLGSVSNSVMHKCKVPVLVVK
ncbi:universal stress protein [Nitrosopumilus maritimus]|uniref:UspA domain protein n=1 Tax=Nitrosopumilus maritimus (strain SCM1) TaxID=436308 RepID=A9A1P0_NITMS|nr:universal stress protein [Nitrosopumilus maritimus]ABX13555.1 UspA domain protein [Nitrosopumilus maritimus SCM1]